MDRRSFCKVLGFAAGSTLLPGLMVRAAGQGSVGHAVPDGRYAIGIRSDLSGCDLTHTFYYSDSFFTTRPPNMTTSWHWQRWVWSALQPTP